MMNIEKSSKEYEEYYNKFSANLSVDLYKLIVCNMIPIHSNKFEEFKKMFEEINLDSLNENWRKFHNCLPHISDKSFLLSNIEFLNLLVSHFESMLNISRIEYNNQYYLELDDWYKNERKISVYDIINANYNRKIYLTKLAIHKMELQIKSIDLEIKKSESIQNNKILTLEKTISEQVAKILLLEKAQTSSQIKYKASQTKVVCYYLIGIKLGIFYNTEDEKPLNKIFENALFEKDGNFKPASSIDSIISRIRNGEDKDDKKSLNKKIKASMIKELELLLKDFHEPNSNINIFNN